MKNESDFQKWITSKFVNGGAHVQDHRESALPHIPDMSAAFRGIDYWLELKHAHVTESDMSDRKKLFEFDHVTAGQLNWLRCRAVAGQARCLLVGCISVEHSRSYLVAFRPEEYIRLVWRRGVSLSSAAMMSTMTDTMSLKTAKDLCTVLLTAFHKPYT